MSVHRCHAEGCTAVVQPRYFACRRHWAKVPRWLQRALWRVYRPGQERDKRPSRAYLLVQKRCRIELAELEGHLSAPGLVASLGRDLRELLTADSPERTLPDRELIARFDAGLGAQSIHRHGK